MVQQLMDGLIGEVPRKKGTPVKKSLCFIAQHRFVFWNILQDMKFFKAQFWGVTLIFHVFSSFRLLKKLVWTTRVVLQARCFLWRNFYDFVVFIILKFPFLPYTFILAQQHCMTYASGIRISIFHLWGSDVLLNITLLNLYLRQILHRRVALMDILDMCVFFSVHGVGDLSFDL